MRNCKISVLVMQYNPIFEKLKATLLSVIVQKDVAFEIVIADDGSKKDFFEEIKGFFEEYHFENYVMVKSENNQGTVCNTLFGLEKCSGTYVKCIAPGDCLYNENVLCNITRKMEEENAGFLFGKMVFYNKDGDSTQIFNESRPYAPDIYKTGDVYKIRKALIIYQDNISGASAFIRRTLLLKLLQHVKDSVIFQEDVTFSMLTFMGEKMIYLDEYVVWYEYGAGISTNGDDKWALRLREDTYKYYNILCRMYGKERYVKRAMCFQRLEMRQGIFWKVLKTILFADRFMFRKKYVTGTRAVFTPPDMEYLENITNESRR